MVPLNVTRKAVLLRRDFEARGDGSHDGMTAAFLQRVCEYQFEVFRTRRGLDGCYLHDPLAMAVALNPSIAAVKPTIVDIETLGELTRGMTIEV